MRSFVVFFFVETEGYSEASTSVLSSPTREVSTPPEVATPLHRAVRVTVGELRRSQRLPVQSRLSEDPTRGRRQIQRVLPGRTTRRVLGSTSTLQQGERLQQSTAEHRS